VQTDTLTTPPMLSPHESLNLNATRGLLAAVNGNLATEPGVVAIYDVHADCRHPVLDSDLPVARFGHESGFAPDGKTFYATSTALQSITAIDVTDPKNPHPVWQGQEYAHGMSLSDDGNRAYVADPKGDLLILDTSEIQARKPDPHAREISRLTWNTASIPQNAMPFTENGKPYLLETDEYTQATLNPGGNNDVVGAARVIDISDETKPFVVSNLRLQVDQPADHAAAAGDPGGNQAPQGYAAHYCDVPTRVDPKIVACSFIESGLRLFDISDVAHPKEIGYYVAPPAPRSENQESQSDFAMSKPAFAPERREVWWTDGTSGFYVLRVDKSVWPQTAASTVGSAPTLPVSSRKCLGRRLFLAKARYRRGAHVRSFHATLAGRRTRTLRRRGHFFAVVDMRRLPRRTVHLVMTVRLASGRTVKDRRTYHACTARIVHPKRQPRHAKRKHAKR
jgi:hypothetical protein